MSKWEVLVLTVRYGEGDRVKSVRRDGILIFSQENISVLNRYLDDLHSKGWELDKISQRGWGDIHLFKRKVD